VAANTPISQIQNSCTGSLKVLETFDPTYSPGVPPYYRFSGTPASAGFKALVEFQPLTSDCAAFIPKYKFTLSHTLFTVSITVPAIDLQNTAIQALKAKGQTIQVNWKQYFRYAYEGELPFFPSFHEETLILEGTLDPHFLNEYYPVDSQKLYGVHSLQQLTDYEKVSLAKEVVDFELKVVKQPGWNVPFTGLLAELKPSLYSSKIAYLKTLIFLFKSLDPDHTGYFFEFEFGGPDGAPIALLMKQLARETDLPMAEVQQLSFLFPSLLLVGIYSRTNTCLPIDNASINANLKGCLSSNLTDEQKSGARRVARDLAENFVSFCVDSFRSDPEIVSLASSLYQKLSSG